MAVHARNLVGRLAAAGSLLLAAAAPVMAGQALLGSETARLKASEQFDRQLSDFRTLSQAASDGSGATGKSLWFDPWRGDRMLDGEAGYSEADTVWAKSNLKLIDVVERLGGSGGQRRQVFQRAADRYYVGLDGMGGRWFTSAGEAQGYLFRMLVSESAGIPGEVKQAVASQGSGDIGALLTAARQALETSRPLVVKGNPTTIRLRSQQLAAADAPHLRGPAGIEVGELTALDDGTFAVTVTASGEAAEGPTTLSAFAANSSFRSLDTFAIFVVPGDGETAAAGDDHGDAAGGATALRSSAAGALERAGDEDVFKLTLAAAGHLTLATSGPTDVVVALQNGAGETLAQDDDSGPWYNASLSYAATPGTYYVRVRHCCNGTGSYTLSRELKTQ